MKIFIAFMLFINFAIAVTLTKKEQLYLKNNKIVRMCNNLNWTPIEFMDKNQKPQGISIDTMKLIEKRVGVKFVHIPTSSWRQSQEFLKAKKCDILPAAIKTQKRMKYANFTRAYLNYDLVIITKNDKPYVANLNNILDKPMSRKESSGLIDKLEERYKDIKILKTNTTKGSFEKISNNESYFTIATLPVAFYYISKFYSYDLRIAGYTDMKYQLRIMVRDDDKILLSLMNKGLKSISSREYQNFSTKWSKIDNNHIPNKKFFINLLIGILILAIIALIYIFIIRRKNNDLEESLENFKILVDTMNEGLLHFEDKKIVSVNDVACQMFGYSQNEFKNRYILDLVEGKDKDRVIEALNSEYKKSFHVCLLKKNGSKFKALVCGRDIFKKGKKIRISTILDIDELHRNRNRLENLNKQLEAKIKIELAKNRRKDEILFNNVRLASLGEMISNIAHQWRQPLNVLNLNIEMLLLEFMNENINEVFLDDFIDKNSKIISDLSKTIDNFRNFYQPDKEKSEFSLKELINEVIKIEKSYLREKSIKINFVENDGRIFGFPSEFKQVLIHLINNSKDAIYLQNDPDGEIKVHLEDKGDYHILTILDNGGGIKEDIMNKIFEPYFTTKFQSAGTGLGLYMSKMIIEKSMHGNLSVQNRDKGAIFIIKLPMS